MKYLLTISLIMLTACSSSTTFHSENCTVTALSNGSLIACPDGTSQVISNGIDGQQGIQGQTGNTGPQGPSGLNGTTITSIQFCPGINTYPSTFPEVGFCINNQIYAVYSANDGFLSLMQPGAYSSNGINSSCNFTILSNCVIQN